MRAFPRSACQSVAMFGLLLVPWLAWPQTPAWQAGIAKVAVRADLSRQAGTAFVVALEPGTALLVTSAHVVEGDASPQIEFVAAPRKQYAATVQSFQARDTYGLHGLAIIVVKNPPAALNVLPPSGSAPLARGDTATIAGYPAPIGEFTVTDTTVGATENAQRVWPVRRAGKRLGMGRNLVW